MDLIRQEPPEVQEIIKAAADKYGLMQSRDGIHATDCIYCLRKAYFSKKDSLPPTQIELFFYLLGLGLQDALIPPTTGVSNEVEKDGILLNPDYYKNGVVAELKTTRMTQKTVEEKGIPDGWLKQMMCYAYALGVKSALLILIPLIKPDILSYVLKFEHMELERNWNHILGAASVLKVALDAEKPKALPRGQEWECRNCRYKLRCDTMDTQHVVTPILSANLPAQTLAELREQEKQNV
jgi:hypothetical protein|tara:strand:+ start:2357 stop:3070 length:714 start_codon:yes stop_codon:yes gene_type:complete